MPDSPEAAGLTRRYKDAYFVCRAIVTVGDVVKAVAFVIAGIIGVISLLNREQ